METIQLSAHADILEKGLTVFKKVLEQEVKVTRDQMFDLVNFELFVTNLITGWREIDGKNPEELLSLNRGVKSDEG